jgi:hypothetical protein
MKLRSTVPGFQMKKMGMPRLPIRTINKLFGGTHTIYSGRPETPKAPTLAPRGMKR